jgi:hypothetical protein
VVGGDLVAVIARTDDRTARDERSERRPQVRPRRVGKTDAAGSAQVIITLV